MNFHQKKQIEVITALESQIKNNAINFTTVAPVNDYEKDTRLCLTSVHLPHADLLTTIQKQVIIPLQQIEPSYYFYPLSSLHMTIKNVRVSNDPPRFSSETIEKAKNVFSQVIPIHQKFTVYFYRLLSFPNNVALIGTTDEEFDNIVYDLDNRLREQGIGDNKKYSNSKYFFINMTLSRFSSASSEFVQKIEELSEKISFTSYIVDSVSLVTTNPVFKDPTKIASWELK